MADFLANLFNLLLLGLATISHFLALLLPTELPLLDLYWAADQVDNIGAADTRRLVCITCLPVFGSVYVMREGKGVGKTTRNLYAQIVVDGWIR